MVLNSLLQCYSAALNQRVLARATSYDRKKAWASISHSILSALNTITLGGWGSRLLLKSVKVHSMEDFKPLKPFWHLWHIFVYFGLKYVRGVVCIRWPAFLDMNTPQHVSLVHSTQQEEMTLTDPKNVNIEYFQNVNKASTPQKHTCSKAEIWKPERGRFFFYI